MFSTMASTSFFFFQAEDGIRDWSVTGVQTCALPISAISWSRSSSGGRISGLKNSRTPRIWVPRRIGAPKAACRPERMARSEERRVGKECRSEWYAYRYEKEGSESKVVVVEGVANI